MNITKIDKKDAVKIGNAFRAMVAKFAEEQGLEYKPAGGRFTPTSFTTKVEFKVAGGSERDCNLNAELHEYVIRFGDTVKCNHMDAKVVDITNRGKVVVLASDNKKYTIRFPEKLVPTNRKETTVASLIPGTLTQTPPPPRTNLTVTVQETVKSTTQFGQLTADWCKCGKSTFLCYPEDGACKCGMHKHHVHCTCGGVSQVG